jgi:hypothetical protein
MATDLQQFNALSKQRLDYESLPGGGQRARMTITLPPMPGYPKGRSFTFVEDVTPQDVKQYGADIAGLEIGCAMALGPVSGVEVGSFFGDIAKGLGGAVKGIAKVAKKVVTSKVMQTAAKGLAMVAPALGPMAPAAIAVSGGIGVAGKLLASKTAQSVGATLASNQIAQSAVADAKALTKSPVAFKGLMNIASNKANNALKLVAKVATSPQAAAASPSNDVMALARAGRIRSNQGGQVTPAQLTAAAGSGRLFFLAA